MTVLGFGRSSGNGLPLHVKGGHFLDGWDKPVGNHSTAILHCIFRRVVYANSSYWQKSPVSQHSQWSTTYIFSWHYLNANFSFFILLAASVPAKLTLYVATLVSQIQQALWSTHSFYIPSGCKKELHNMDKRNFYLSCCRFAGYSQNGTDALPVQCTQLLLVLEDPESFSVHISPIGTLLGVKQSLLIRIYKSDMKTI